MSVALSPKYDWMLCYSGAVAKYEGRFPDADEAEGAWEQFGADHSPDECAWEAFQDGAR